MDNIDKKKLQELVESSEDALDNTEQIRELKQSELIKRDINRFLKFEGTHNLLNIQEQYPFLYKNYPEILSKLLNNKNFDIKILIRLINILQQIEDGVCDQHEGSVTVGQILKEIYVDPILEKEKIPKKEISYNDYKNKIKK